MKKFSKEQEKSIEEKIELYSSLLEKDLPHEELMRRVKEIENKIIEKRLKWYEEYKNELDYLKIEELRDIQKAFILLYGHQMEIPRKDVGTFPMYDGDQGYFIVYIQSRNFCPYLEAFKRMNIRPKDSVKLCELTLEKPCQILVDKVNPKIKFFRSYPNIRPIKDFCDERLFMVDYSIAEKMLEQGEDPSGLFIGKPEHWEMPKNL